MSRRLKVLVLLESDVTIRHFVASGAMAELVRRHAVKFIFPKANYKRISSNLDELDLSGAPYERVDIPDERVSAWRRLFQVNQLRWRPGQEFSEIRRFFRQVLGWKGALLLTALGLPVVYWFLKRHIRQRLERAPCPDFFALIEREKPDLLVHPSTFDGYFINDFVDAGRRYGVKTVLVMNSWDNPSIKQSITGQPDRCLVWGEQTRNHAIKFMHLDPAQVLCTGSAQFDVFRFPPRLTRDEFCREHGIDPAKKVVLYAGSSKQTDEFKHLRQLDEAVERGDLSDTVILYRPHPWGDGGHGGERIRTYPWRHVVFERSMVAYLDQVASGDKSMFTGADYARTHDVLSSIDALLSPLSTIILEALLHGKPAMCFLPWEEQSQAHHLRIVGRLVHFEDMFTSPAVVVAEGAQNLLPGLRKLIERVDDSENFRPLARKAARHFVEQPDGSYGENLSNVLERIAGGTV